MSHQTLELRRDGAMARITLDRPPANALDLTMARELAEVALVCDEDPEVRVVVLTGRGKAFCAGGDLASFGAAGERVPTLLKEVTAGLHVAIARFARMRAPVIAAVNGVAAGAGFSLVTACDLAVAAASARFTMAYTRAGLAPDGSSTFFLPRLIGLRRTQELMITNRMLGAAEALEWGLDAWFPTPSWRRRSMLRARGRRRPDRCVAAVSDCCSCRAATASRRRWKRRRARSPAARRPDGREGIAAFPRRPPRFDGR
jgi:2-(1,2-epoxy-1,2-dihydrophenyl)acetyl-CoA isomerase